MAVRLDASGDVLSRTTNLPTITSFTIMGWVKISVDLNDYSTFFKFGVAGSSTAYLVDTQGDGVTLGVYNGSSEAAGSVLTVGTWYHVATTVSGTGTSQFLTYLNGVLDISYHGNTGPTASEMIIGAYTTAGAERLNGCVAAIKVYSAVLTATEIVQEMRQYAPVRMANLNGWYPCLSTSDDEVDYSGNGNNWTVGGTLATEQGPPIVWRSSRQRRVYIVSGGGTTYQETLASSITAASTVVKGVSKIVSGSITASSTVSKIINKVYSGSLNGSSSAVKKINKVLSGSITAVSAVATSATRSVTLASSITAVAVAVKTVNKVSSSSVNAASVVVRGVSKILSGSVTAVSSIVPSAIKLVVFDSGIAVVSSVSKYTGKIVQSTIVGESSIVKAVAVSVSESVAAASQIVKVVRKVVSDSITAISDVVVTTGVVERVFEASVTAASAVVKRVDKAVSESVIASSSMIKIVLLYFFGSVTIVSSVVKEVRRVVSGSITAQSVVTAGRITALVFNSSITIVSALLTQFVAGSGVVAQRMLLFLRRRRRS